MIPGAVFPADGDSVLNAGLAAVAAMVANRGERCLQVGSHYHFAETVTGLVIDRVAARGMRLTSSQERLFGSNPVKPVR